jgi:hypothetical protein
MRLCAALLLLALAGCASTDDAPPPAPLRFAAIAGPRVGHDGAEDALLEVVTTLSLEADLDVALVAGPLVANEEPLAREGLVGALGSIAAPTYVALSPTDGPLAELLETLERGLPKHPGTAQHGGPAVKGWRPVAVGPAGELPPAEPAASDDDDDDGPLPVIAARGGPGAPPEGVRLVVVTGDAPSLSADGGVVTLTLPPLSDPPHLFAIGTISPEGEVSVSLRTAFGATPPAPLAPVRARVH